MIKEEQTLNVSMFINLALAIIKIVCGIFFNSYILMMLGYFTLCNYINEAIAYIGSVISMRKANMKHPFGFGKQESILHIFVGKREAMKLSYNISMIITIIVTAIASIGILYYKNIAIFFIVMYLWVIVLKEAFIYRKIENLYKEVNNNLNGSGEF